MLILCRSGLPGAQLSHSALFFHSAPLLLRGLARRPYLTVCASFSLARSLSPLCTKSVYSDSRAVQNSFFYQLVTRPVSSALRPVVRLQYVRPVSRVKNKPNRTSSSHWNITSKEPVWFSKRSTTPNPGGPCVFFLTECIKGAESSREFPTF